jgi:FlaA1/EpsC-like NDP-sugar epimerase
VARLRPARLLLVERSECALFATHRELRAAFPFVEMHALVADVADTPRMRWILETFRPEVLLHAAAHKHVAMMEQNPAEAVKNNTLATHSLARLAGTCDVGVFVLISTDKAVRPRSVMGATKRLAELAVKQLSGRSATRFVTVRFGNVIGSAGSVLPIFREQIANGGPVTVTHPDVTRYFMTIPEAAQLVLQAASMGGAGQLYILDMGEPVKILDLATDTIRLSGLRPHEDIEIAFTGLGPAEKLFEELQTSTERVTRTRHQQIFVGEITPLAEHQLADVFEHLERLAAVGDEMLLRQYLNEVLPEAQIDCSEKMDIAVNLSVQVANVS